MREIDFLIKLLYESIGCPTCKYYQGDEEPCLKNKSHLTCNCDGVILECDLPKEEDK
jgi:hypothetical protein